MEQSTRKLHSDAAAAAAMSPQAGTGSPLYVINLCASMTPIAQADKVIPGFESYRVYQVSRKEDGRVRYRLRLGFFADQAEAETALALIRDHYPTAFATSLSDDDQRHSRGFGGSASPVKAVAKAETPRPQPAKPATTSAAPATHSTAITAKAAVKPASSAVAPSATATVKATTPAPAKPSKPAETSAPPAARAPASDTQRTPALKVDKAVEVECEWEPDAIASAPTAPQVSKPEKPAATPAAAQTRPAAPAQRPAPAPAAAANAELTLAADHVQSQAAPAKPTNEPFHVARGIEIPASNLTTLPSEPTAPAPAAAARSNEPFHVGKGVDIPASDLSTLEAEPAAAASKPAAAGNQPFHVGRGAEIPDSVVALMLDGGDASTSTGTPSPIASKPTPASQPRTSATAAAKMSGAKTAASNAKETAAGSAATKTPALSTPIIVGDDIPLPELDSTQTIRALTPEELDDETQPKWFAVQLAVSDQPINLETMPHLDIFAAYRLYSVATAGSGKILHHMRIGFFKEQVSAEAVCGYLKTFFANPTVLRVSQAEYKRFAEAPPLPTPPEAKAKVIDITAARDRTPVREVPVVTMEVVNPATTGRFPQPNLEATGSHKRPSTTATGKHAVAAKSAARSKSAHTSTGKHKSLHEALLAEAREVALSESAVRRLPKNNSLFSKLFGKK